MKHRLTAILLAVTLASLTGCQSHTESQSSAPAVSTAAADTGTTPPDTITTPAEVVPTTEAAAVDTAETAPAESTGSDLPADVLMVVEDMKGQAGGSYIMGAVVDPALEENAPLIAVAQDIDCPDNYENTSVLLVILQDDVNVKIESILCDDEGAFSTDAVLLDETVSMGKVYRVNATLAETIPRVRVTLTNSFGNSDKWYSQMNGRDGTILTFLRADPYERTETAE